MKVTILILTIFFASAQQQSGYYWREYFGQIPGDALPAGGRNNDGTYSYIGQGSLRNFGLMPSTITPGIQEISVYWVSVKPSKYNKILCGSQNDFYWQKINSTDLNVQISGKYAVIGGHDDTFDGPLRTGRIWVEGKYIIGKVGSYDNGNAYYLYYVDGGVEKHVSSYEILIYNNVVNTRVLPGRRTKT